MDIHIDIGSGQLDINSGVVEEVRAGATDLTVVGLWMVFSAVRLGEVSWGEGVAKERRGLRTEPWGSPAFIENPEKDGQWGGGNKQENVVSSDQCFRWKEWY